MKIPVATYADVSRRIDSIGTFVFLGTAAIGLLILVTVGVPFAEAVRDFIGGSTGQLLAMVISIPLVCLPLYLPLIAIQLIDRRIGIRCPGCNVSLTLRCLREKILITRKCSSCHSVVLTDDDFSDAVQPSRPWGVGPLLVVLLVLIICFVDADLSSPSSLMKRTKFWSETAIELLLFFAIAQGYSMVMKVKRRRWENEAAAKDSDSRTNCEKSP